MHQADRATDEVSQEMQHLTQCSGLCGRGGSLLSSPPPSCTCRVHADEQLVTRIMSGEVDVSDVVPPEAEVKVQK